MSWIWGALGTLALALGAAGLVLPLVPTVPFLLLAAFCFARSSERLHSWLLTHPLFGPPIQDWQRSGAISRRGKWLATGSMALVLAVSFALGVQPKILAVQAVVLCLVALFIWTRPAA